ncbi:beta-galactosidase [Bifidobacterium catenulatum]|uniref:beta-galactosidase n=1 Tax=Bifidobacterium catenulatum TaxID=1686 RepID=UPI001182CF7B|nr:beta-galactosidase [Bifidobacterium catenulatum]
MSYGIDLSETRKLARTSAYMAPIIRAEAACRPDGEILGATNRFLTRDGLPWIPIAGEMHYSRVSADRWDTELAKMAAAGIDVISTYVFWNHHEEREGEWDFSGNRNVRRFVDLCARHGLYVIVRLGPFCHGEARNGGLPDWLYGKPYEVRSLDEGFLDVVRGLYSHIAEQLRGLYFKEGGPIIAAQVDNEYMASSAPWEMTAGASREWVPSGHDGARYLQRLRDIAFEEGIDPPMFTCTGWQSPVPDDMLPLWGGYAYRPWLFYDGVGAERPTEHPATDEYRYRSLQGPQTSADFDPPYNPDSRLYACCEMGGGMFNSYDYRFALPYRSVDAMTNIKLGSGCDFLGYYMFHGGTNPKGLDGFLNEGQVPKRSYDFQAPLGEFGQMRESFQRLRTLHEFVKAFGLEFAGMPVSLQDGQDRIDPSDRATLRYAVRSDGERGFVFINNFQDHVRVPSRHGERIDVTTAAGECIQFDGIGLARDENCILPFNMDLDGVRLICANLQPITVLRPQGRPFRTFVFLKPDGMDKPTFRFEGLPDITVGKADFERFTIRGTVEIICVTRKLARRMTVLDGGLAFVDDDNTLLYMDDGEWMLETRHAENGIATYPQGLLDIPRSVEPVDVDARLKRLHADRCEIILPDGMGQLLHNRRKVADILLNIEYQGDIGWLFCGDDLISDNFCNGGTWQVGLRDYADAIDAADGRLTLVITPMRRDSRVNVASSMAARLEQPGVRVSDIADVYATPVYHMTVGKQKIL